ncbi:MAG: RNA-binding protein [Verrucomicrobia bacterium]|nr:RNA-binding protein [Verrucomicrobiota bacterium]
MNQALNKKLYVGSLPFSTTEEELHDLFASYGPITSVRIVIDKFTGMSKGFGFVEMESSEDAQKAVEALNGSSLNGRTLIVNEARPEQPRAPRGRDDRGGGFRGGNGGGDRPYRSPRREH